MEKLSTSSFTLYSVFHDKTVFDYGEVVNYLTRYALKYRDPYASQVVSSLNPFLNSGRDKVCVDCFEVMVLFKMVNYIHELHKNIDAKEELTYENTSYIKGQKKGLNIALDKFFEEFDDL